MAQDLTTKQVHFTDEYVKAVTSVLDGMDYLATLKKQWDANAFATGANPSGNNITDAIIQDNGYAYMTAAQLNSAVGAVESLQSTLASNRGYLEAVRK